MAYEVPALPYAYDALEPHIDEATMRVHHDKHHQAYVDKANGALEGTEWDGKPVEEVLKNLDALPADKQKAVRNNGGGHYNHTLFWESMSPDGGGEPTGALADAINSAFGSFSDFQAKVKETGVNQFGSGWAWLVHDGSGLAVVGSAEPGQPDLRRLHAAARRRRLGARVLPEVPEQAPGLHRRVVERGRLGCGRRAVRQRRFVTNQCRVCKNCGIEGGHAAGGRDAWPRDPFRSGSISSQRSHSALVACDETLAIGDERRTDRIELA